MSDELLGRRRLESLTEHQDAAASLAHDVVNDPDKREAFLKDPSSFLSEAGVPFPGEMELTERDRELIRIATDPEIEDIYLKGEVDRLKDYIRETYPGLVSDRDKVAWAVSDFEVAIEAVAVAVGVFVAPLRPVDKVSEVSRLESVMNARHAELEARLVAVEKRIG